MADIDLKPTLKKCKSLLGDGKYEEVIEHLQPFINRDVEDVNLFIFAGLANANTQYYEFAQEFYEKAIKLDSSKTNAAWLGLFKLYDENHISDQRGLEVCDKIIEIGDETKKEKAVNIKRKLLLKFSKYEELSDNLGDDPNLMAEIVNKIEKSRNPNEIEKKILAEAFSRLESSFTGTNDFTRHWYKYCQYLAKNEKAYKNQLLDFCFKVQDKTEDESKWCNECLIEFLAEDYFIQSSVNDDKSWSFIDETDISEKHLQSYQLLKHIKEEDVTSALEFMDQLSHSQIFVFPNNVICCRLLLETENWEQLVKLSNLIQIKPSYPPEMKIIKNWLIVKGNLEIDGTVPDKILVDECCTSDHVPSEFIREMVILSKNYSSKNENWKAKLSEFEQIRVNFLESFYMKDYAAAVDIGSKLIQYSEATWMDLLEYAEARFAIQQDCVTILVKAAKLAPRSSRVFYMLGKALQKKNPTKAKGCLERAVKIRPFNEEYVRILDDLLVDMKEKSEVRLSFLKSLAVKVRSKWVRERIAELALTAGDLETATNEFQKLSRESPTDIHIWAKLADAYTRKGHLNSAVSAYEQILKIEPKSEHYISLLGLLIRLGKDEEALESCISWRKMNPEINEATKFVDILETMAHLRLSLLKFGEEKMDHLRRAVILLTPVISKEPEFALPYKLAGDILLQISWYHEKFFESFKLDPTWQITPQNILEKATNFYVTALQFCKENIHAWSDLIISLLLQSQVTGEIEPATNAIEIIKKAITLTEFAATKSTFWTLLGEARRLSKDSPASQQHCYIRALNLNKANDEAWLRLALVYIESDKKIDANQCLETALKYNPHLAEAWCAWALNAEREGELYEASAMYKQALTIKSLPLAVIRVTSMICEEMKQNEKAFDTSSVLTEFPEIFDIYYSSQTKGNSLLLSHLGVLAELFGHYTEAIICHKDAGTSNSNPNLQRALLKEGTSMENSSALNESWVEMAKEPIENLLEIVKQNPIYGELFKLLEEDDEESNGLWELFSKYRKQISMPLVISAIILFNIEIKDSVVEVLHDVWPRHELIDVFPTVLPEGMDNELQYLEEDGETPFRYRHEIAKQLYEELQKKREELENSSTS